MAIDTARKRASALSAMRPFLSPLMVPTGTLDRQAAAWMYAGIPAGALVIIELIRFTSVAMLRPVITLYAQKDYAALVKSRAGLVAYWRLGEASGAVAREERTIHHGTYEGAPTLGQAGALTGDADACVDFLGVDERVRVSDHAAFTFPTSLSVECWAWADATGADIVCHGTPGNTNVSGFSLNAAAGIGGAYFSVNDNVGTGVRAGFTMPTGRWVHLVGVHDDVAGKTRLYLDGALTAEVTAVEGSIGTNSGAPDLFIGYGTERGPYFNGRIDEVAVYNVALTDQRVFEHYVAGRGLHRGMTAPALGSPVIRSAVFDDVTLLGVG